MSEHHLEPAAQGVADATADPPFIFELGVEDARKVEEAVHVLRKALGTA